MAHEKSLRIFTEEHIMRINKYIAHCGYCSRRKADELIEKGRVFVNGKCVNDFSIDVDDNDIVTIENKVISLEQEKIYIMLNKPSGYISAVSDDRGRKTVLDLVQKHYTQRLYPVGRLDYQTEGLLILTNDGELANKLIHPSSNIKKTYYVELDRMISAEKIRKIESGVDIGGYITKKAKIKRIGPSINTNKCIITICEGKNRQVRKMFETQHLHVKYLKRLQIGELYLNDLKQGEFRYLNKKEIDYLMSIN